MYTTIGNRTLRFFINELNSKNSKLKDTKNKIWYIYIYFSYNIIHTYTNVSFHFFHIEQDLQNNI